MEPIRRINGSACSASSLETDTELVYTKSTAMIGCKAGA